MSHQQNQQHEESGDEESRRRNMDQRREDLRYNRRSAEGMRHPDQVGMHRADATGGRDAVGHYHGPEQQDNGEASASDDEETS